MDPREEPQGATEPRSPLPRPADKERARRLLLKVAVYAAPAVLATALTAENAYAVSF